MCACVCTTFLRVHFAQSCSSPKQTSVVEGTRPQRQEHSIQDWNGSLKTAMPFPNIAGLGWWMGTGTCRNCCRKLN